MEAYDNGSPPRSDITIVKVEVDRNLNVPRYDETNVEVEILYSQELGVPIATVTAIDEDPQVCNDVT